jgi:HAD superfamily hydrolase (TIGR01549 family)
MADGAQGGPETGEAGPIAILDVDGTLVDTNYHHSIAWSRALLAHGKVVPLVDLHRHMGMGGDQLVAQVAGEDFDRAHGDDARAREKEEYGKLIGEVQALEQATELVQALQERGCRVILSSSAKEEEVEHYLELLHLTDEVPYTTSADVEQTKPEPDLIRAALDKMGGDGDAIMIGDSTWDCEAAKRAGVRTFALLTGGFGAEELREAGAEAVYRRLPDLIGDLGALFEAAAPASAD